MYSSMSKFFATLNMLVMMSSGEYPISHKCFSIYNNYNWFIHTHCQSNFYLHDCFILNGKKKKKN